VFHSTNLYPHRLVFSFAGLPMWIFFRKCYERLTAWQTTHFKLVYIFLPRVYLQSSACRMAFASVLYAETFCNPVTLTPCRQTWCWHIPTKLF